MTIDGKVRNEHPQHDINRKAAKYQHYYQVKSININSLQVKKYYHLIKV